MIDPTSKDDPKFKELVKVLIDWINDVLVEERIIVKQLEEDLTMARCFRSSWKSWQTAS